MLKLKKNHVLHILFNLGFWTFFWGAFEQALQNGQPIWSGTLGYPTPHHYIIGAILCYCAYLGLIIKHKRIFGYSVREMK